MSFNLIGNRILIVPNPPLDKIGSIWLPEQSKESRNSGLVVLIGDTVDKKFDKRQVLYNKLAEVKMIYEGLECIMIWQPDIIAILD